MNFQDYDLTKWKVLLPKDSRQNNCLLLSFKDLPNWLIWEIHRLGRKINEEWIEDNDTLYAAPVYGNRFSGFGWEVFHQYEDTKAKEVRFLKMGRFYSDSFLGKPKTIISIIEVHPKVEKVEQETV